MTILVADLTLKHVNNWTDRTISVLIFLSRRQNMHKNGQTAVVVWCGNGASHTTTFYHATHHRGLVFALNHLSCLWICEQKAWLHWVLERWLHTRDNQFVRLMPLISIRQSATHCIPPGQKCLLSVWSICECDPGARKTVRIKNTLDAIRFWEM
jgi:hypothetical protein